MELKSGWSKRILRAGETQQKAMEEIMSAFKNRTDALPQKLLSLIMQEYLPKFETNAQGIIEYNSKNLALASELEQTFNKFNRLYYQNYLGQFAMDNLKFIDLNMAYYGALGVSQSVLKPAVANITELLTQRMGIAVGKGLSDSKLIAGSYLDNLLTAAPVREQVKNFVLQSISGRSAYSDFLSGMQTLVAGDENADGRLLRYVKQYTYDTYSQTQRIVSGQFAEQAQFKSFYYQGSLIETSREFCQDYAGKIITVDMIEQFDTMDWRGKIPDVPFRVQCGGYQCRHFLDGIPDEAINDETKNAND